MQSRRPIPETRRIERDGAMRPVEDPPTGARPHRGLEEQNGHVIRMCRVSQVVLVRALVPLGVAPARAPARVQLGDCVDTFCAQRRRRDCDDGVLRAEVPQREEFTDLHGGELIVHRWDAPALVKAFELFLCSWPTFLEHVAIVNAARPERRRGARTRERLASTRAGGGRRRRRRPSAEVRR